MCCLVLPPEIIMHDAYIGGRLQQTKIINFTKTKEMILDPLEKSPPQLLSDCSTNNPVSVERVQHFKLLGIILSHMISVGKLTLTR